MTRRASSEKHTFYVGPDGFAQGAVVFPRDEAQHAVRVLRLQAGDVVHVVDGEGSRFRVRLDTADRRGVIGAVIDHQQPSGAPGLRVTLAFGMLKHAGRYETILEKATELGVARLVPLQTERTERVSMKDGRHRAILISAMKQSGSASLPILRPVTTVDALLEMSSGIPSFVCHEEAPTTDALPRLAARLPAESRDVTVAVGPEGGFSPDEIARFISAGWTVASLGPTRLRTETAAIVAAASMVLSRG